MNNKRPNKYRFILGLLLAIIGAILMYFGILPISARITIGIVGIALIATSNYRLL